MDLTQAYKILGLNGNEGADEVKAAYKKLAQKYSVDAYDSSPLKEDAQRRLDEITEAFDVVMSNLRMGGGQGGYGGSSSASKKSSTSGAGSTSERYSAIRQKINHGSTDEALNELNSIPDGSQNAEWNFLVGSAYYYKGWVNDAIKYFQTASRLDPSNREYSNALNNLKNNQNGNMYGSPYGNRNGSYGSPVACSCCDMCAAFMCMDMCCSCGGC